MPTTLEFHANIVSTLYLIKVHRLIKQYSNTDRDFIYAWAEHYCEITDIIFGLICKEDWLWPVPPPTENIEEEYQSLRYWFIVNEGYFVPLWRDFYWSVSPNWQNSPDESEFKDGDEQFLEIPCFFLYRCENLIELACEMDIQDSIEHWEPDRDRSKEALKMILCFTMRVVEFVNWVEDRTE